VFFSIPRGKRSLYLMPAYPWLAAWLGLDLAERLEAAKTRLGAVRVSLGVLALVIALIAVALPIFEREKAAELGIDVPLGPPIAMLGLIVGALAVAVASPRRMRHALAVAGVGWALFYGVFVVVAYPAIDASRSAERFIEEVEARVVDDAQPAMLQFRAQFGIYAGRMLEAHPSEPASMERVAERLAGSEPFWVLMKQHFVEELEPYLAPGVRPVTIHDRLVGDDHYVVLGNEAALDDGSEGAG
jgi:4-amino-4-deoxy-L-arabinose transferase-like glycosyltransferase